MSRGGATGGKPYRPWEHAPAHAAHHLGRMRREGFVRVVREDLARARIGLRRAAWRVDHDFSPNAVPIYIVGIQRSGTDMLVEAFSEAPEAEIHNESASSRAFFGFALREDDVVRSIIESSRHRCVVFKPLCDAHRIVHLMEGLGTPRHGRAVWIYRDVGGRVRSVLAKWPENNRRVIRALADGYRGWEAGGLSEERLELVKSFDLDRLSQASGAALLWYLRNVLFFDLGLDRRSDVALVSYERFLSEPEWLMQALCDLAGIPFRSRMVGRVGARPPAVPGELDIDGRVVELCEGLRRQLDEELDRRLAKGMLTGQAAAARS